MNRCQDSITNGDGTGERTVSLLQTGVANIASVRAALKRFGVTPRAVASPEEVLTAPFVLVPGVGTFGSSIEALGDYVTPLKERIAARKKTLLICVGFQLLFTESEESPGVRGLGVIEGAVRRFPTTVAVPQMGWNRVVANSASRYVRDGEAYYANSYRVSEVSSEWCPSWSDYGSPFVSAIECGGVLGCQFHPELSSGWGAGLLQRWLESPEQGER